MISCIFEKCAFFIFPEGKKKALPRPEFPLGYSAFSEEGKIKNNTPSRTQKVWLFYFFDKSGKFNASHTTNPFDFLVFSRAKPKPEDYR